MSNSKAIIEKDIDYLEQRFKKAFVTKDDLHKVKSELINILDKILKEILTSREEQTLISRKVTDIDDRVTSLENIHPQGQHPRL